jgi:hypothetical protein
MDAVEFLDIIETAFKDDQEVSFADLNEDVVAATRIGKDDFSDKTNKMSIDLDQYKCEIPLHEASKAPPTEGAILVKDEEEDYNFIVKNTHTATHSQTYVKSAKANDGFSEFIAPVVKIQSDTCLDQTIAPSKTKARK